PRHARLLAILPLNQKPAARALFGPLAVPGFTTATWKLAIVLTARTRSLNLAVSTVGAKPLLVNAFASLLASTLAGTAEATVDVTPPSVPVPALQSETQTSVTISWPDSIDDSG